MSAPIRTPRASIADVRRNDVEDVAALLEIRARKTRAAASKKAASIKEEEKKPGPVIKKLWTLTARPSPLCCGLYEIGSFSCTYSPPCSAGYNTSARREYEERFYEYARTSNTRTITLEEVLQFRTLVVEATCGARLGLHATTVATQGDDLVAVMMAAGLKIVGTFTNPNTRNTVTMWIGDDSYWSWAAPRGLR